MIAESSMTAPPRSWLTRASPDPVEVGPEARLLNKCDSVSQESGIALVDEVSATISVGAAVGPTTIRPTGTAAGGRRVGGAHKKSLGP